MKFLIDAQLPRRLAAQLRQAGFDQLADSFSTFDFIELNRTSVICHL